MTPPVLAAPVTAYRNARSARTARRLRRPGGRRFPWFAVLWRQHGGGLVLSWGAFVIAVTALLISEPQLREIAADIGPRRWPEMGPMFYGPRYPDLAMQAIPLLTAIFVGVEVASRELEDGSAAFAWTQGYAKSRWLLGKLTAAAAALVPAAVILGLIFGWWYQLYAPATGYFQMHAFALYAPALVGWTVAGLTLGMVTGAVTRRKDRAVWFTLIGWVALHKLVSLGTPKTPAAAFWPLQFAELAILLAISALFTAVTLAVLRGAPVVPGMPRLIRDQLWPRREARLTRALAAYRPRLAFFSVAWRQHRTGLLIALGLFATYAAFLLVTGLRIHGEPVQVRPLPANLTNGTAAPSGSDGSLILALLLPFVIGTYLGATVAGREYLRGTTAFGLAQGTTRTRWVTGKLITVGLMLVAAAAAAGLVFQWWNQPYLAGRLDDPAFALYPPVYAGWAAVCFTTGAFAGAATRRRTDAANLSLFVLLVLAAFNAGAWRPHYLPPVVAINRPAPPDSYYVDQYFASPDGRPLTGAASYQVNDAVMKANGFQQKPNGFRQLVRMLGQHHAVNVQVYVPASDFWRLQAIESGGQLGISLFLGGATVWIVRRRDA